MQANLLPLGKVHLHIALALFGSIATVAAKLSFVWLLVVGYSESLPASFKYVASLLMLHFVTT